MEGFNDAPKQSKLNTLKFHTHLNFTPISCIKCQNRVSLWGAMAFVKYDENHKKVWIYSRKSKASSAKVRDVRWGDYLNIQNQSDRWAEIKWGTKKYFIETKHITDERPLEVLFVDVGQGDGCIITSAETGADERIYIMDAGDSRNMFDLVKWRFGKLKKFFKFAGAVITHPDADHYKGFQRLFDHNNVGFDKVYHNGLLERTGDDLLGPSDPSGRYLTDIIDTDAKARNLYADPAVRGRKLFPKLLHTAITSGGRIGDIEMLAVGKGQIEGAHTYLPEFAPSDGKDATIEIIGPIPETLNGETALRWFGSDIGSGAKDNGKTKNGHSVLMQLKVKNFTLFFGGDLNRPAEDYLLRHYSGIEKDKPLSNAINKAGQTLRSDMMKCCHHGAADVTNEFIRTVDAFAFVVSSGDSESHAHPRPDLLGRLGKLARGDTPMIFCTEILRSTDQGGTKKRFTALRKLDRELAKLKDQIADLVQNGQDTSETKNIVKDKTKGRKELQKSIEKGVIGVYGAITLRTDGKRMEISFRLESPRGKQLWQSYRLENKDGTDWHIVSDGAH